MPIEKTEAIVLRISPFSRTSHIVTWLSPEHGRLVTSIKGACRPKSAFLGQYDVAARCELLFYRREHEGVHVARECSPLAGREALHDDWRAAAVAAYLCDLVGRVSQPMLDAAGLFAELDAVLDLLAAGHPPEPLLLRFELALLGHMGVAPSLSACPACTAAGAASVRFGLLAGRIVCAHMPPPAPEEVTVAVSTGLLEVLRRWQAARAPAPVAPPPDQNLAVGLRRFLGMFMQCHLEVAPASRRALFAWLDLDPAAWGGHGDAR